MSGSLLLGKSGPQPKTTDRMGKRNRGVEYSADGKVRRIWGVEIGEDGRVVDQPDRSVRPKPSPDQGFLCGEPGKEPVGDLPRIPPGVRFVDAPSPLPFLFWAAYLVQSTRATK